MKKLLVFSLFLSSFAFASGKLQVRPAWFLKSEKFGPQIGMAIYEPVLLGINYNQWTGFGWQPRVGESSVFYAVSSHELETWINRVGVSVGYKFQHADQEAADLLSDHCVFAKLSYKLW